MVNFVVVLAIPSPMFRAWRLTETLHTASDSVAVNGDKVPPWNMHWHEYETAGLSPASNCAGLEVVSCDTSIYQMSTGSRQGAKLDSPGALRKSKMVQSPTLQLLLFQF